MTNTRRLFQLTEGIETVLSQRGEHIKAFNAKENHTAQEVKDFWVKDLTYMEILTSLSNKLNNALNGIHS